MGNTSKVVIGLIMIAVLMVIFPIVMSSTHDLQTDEYTQVAEVTTGVGVTAGDVVLTYAAWNDSNSSVISVVSSEETDTPVIGTYTAATKTLNITGLAESLTRNITLVYEHDALTSFTGMGSLVGITPLLLWISVIATVIGGAWFAVRGRSTA